MTNQTILKTAIAVPLTVAAPMLSTTVNSLRHSVKHGTIPGTRVGGRWMIPTSYLRAIASEGTPDYPEAA